MSDKDMEVVFMCLVLYAISMAFIYAGNSPMRVARWAWKNKGEALYQLTYGNAMFWFPVALATVYFVHWAVGLLCVIRIIVLRWRYEANGAAVDFSEPPPRVRLPD